MVFVVNNRGCCDCIGSKACAVVVGLLSIVQACWHVIVGFVLQSNTARSVGVISEHFGTDKFFWSLSVDEAVTSFRHLFIAVAIMFGITSTVLLFQILKKTPGKMTSWLVVSGIHLCYTLIFGIGNVLIVGTSAEVWLIVLFDVALGIFYWLIIFWYGRRAVGEIGMGEMEGAKVEYRNAE